MVIDRKKKKAADSYFQATQNKVGKDMCAIMLYGNGSFPLSPKDEDSAPTGSMKRHFLTRGAEEHRTSMGCPFCQKKRSCAGDGGWKSTGNQYIAGLAWLHCVQSGRRSWTW